MKEDAKRATQAVTKKHDELISLTMAGDTKKLAAMFHPEFVAVSTDGKQTTAQDEISSLGKLKLESNEIKNYNVITFGQFAIATGVAHTKGTYNGKDISGAHKFFQVWGLNPARAQSGATSFAAAASADMMLMASVNLA
jgi:ketosteroid isomerase-like protein